MSTPKYRKSITKKIIKLIETEYDIQIHETEQLFLGADKDSYVYKVKLGNNKTCFLKIRTGLFIEPSVTIPYILYNALLPQKTNRHIIEPIKTSKGNLFFKMEDCTVILYPFITGQSGIQRDLAETQWIELGKLLYQIHNFKWPPDTASPEALGISWEKFGDEWVSSLANYMKELETRRVDNNYEKQFINLLVSRKKFMNDIIARTEELVSQIKTMELKYCICHADLHAANIFISDDNNFFIVDWDTLIFAPKERDLMFIGGGVANKWNKREEEELFYRGYGEYDKVNRAILSYYRYVRIIEDMVVYYDEFFADNANEKNQLSIIETVESTFMPGNVVDIAFKTDPLLYPD